MDELKFVGGNGNSIKLDYSRGFLGAEIQIDWGRSNLPHAQSGK